MNSRKRVEKTIVKNITMTEQDSAYLELLVKSCEMSRSLIMHKVLLLFVDYCNLSKAIFDKDREATKAALIKAFQELQQPCFDETKKQDEFLTDIIKSIDNMSHKKSKSTLKKESVS